MSKLIFNPEKDMKELEKYGFIKVKKGMTNFAPCVKYWLSYDEDEYDCLTFFKDGRLWVGMDTRGDSQYLVIIYKLIKANLIIDEEELNETNRTTNN